MITEMSSKINPSNNNARWVFALCVSLGISLALISTFIPVYKGIISLVGVVLLVIGIAVFSKYIAVTYYYDITTDNNGVPIFVVRQIIGKRTSTLCRIDIADIVKIENETAKERRKHKTPAGYCKYSYLPTLMPKKNCRLTVDGKYEKAEILIENESYAEMLMRYADLSR